MTEDEMYRKQHNPQQTEEQPRLSAWVVKAGPTPTEGFHYVPAPRPCPHCSGSGIVLDADLQLEGYCPECFGTGEAS